ncbi:MAG: alginate export family protein [Candidatus Hydrogenedentes bacterium]|nr:alginate export family protein [Candidatus Hydrogenedentota bacterium]
MKRRTMAIRVLVLALAGIFSAVSYAELQNVEVGGSIRIRARSFENSFDTLSGTPPRALRIPMFFLPERPIGPFGTNTHYDWSTRGNDRNFLEESARLNVRADFTNDVSSFVELRTYGMWGRDFRSNYITGQDTRFYQASTAYLYQGYIQTDNTFGYPLTLRLGRQELHMGKGWLIGSKIGIQDRSYDAIRLTYSEAPLTVEAFAAKLLERGTREQDGDTDLYGIYGTYAVCKECNASLYWYLVRDGRRQNDTNFAWFPERVEDAFGVDDYDPTNMNTVGTRLWGAYAGWDYDLELAYQFGNADSVGVLFKTGTYGDDRASYGHAAADLEVGYRFDVKYQPRVFVGGAYYGGEDKRGISFWQWLSPFDRPEASVSFNRLFPDSAYNEVIDNHRTLSNFNQIRMGVSAKPWEKVTTALSVSHFEANARFDRPRTFSVGRFAVPVAPSLSFWTKQSSGDLGYLTDFSVKYDYSSDLYFRFVWQHMFTGSGLSEGNFVIGQGLEYSGGTGHDDADYFCFDTGITF